MIERLNKTQLIVSIIYQEVDVRYIYILSTLLSTDLALVVAGPGRALALPAGGVVGGGELDPGDGLQPRAHQQQPERLLGEDGDAAARVVGRGVRLLQQQRVQREARGRGLAPHSAPAIARVWNKGRGWAQEQRHNNQQCLWSHVETQFVFSAPNFVRFIKILGLF